MRVSQFFAALVVCSVSVSVAHANGNYFSLAGGNFAQDWSDTSLITADDNWDNVPSIIGYRGDNDANSITGVDPQTLLTPNTNVVDVIANLAVTTTATGGVQELEINDPTVAIQGSGTADAPFLLFFMDASGRENINISYLLRDLDGSTDNAIQQFALQYRTDTVSNFVNVPSGYVPDATTQATATQTTPVTATLPSGANNASTLQIRIITTNAVGNDEIVGIDDINIASAAVIPEANTFGLLALALPIIGGVIARRRK